MYTIRQAIYHGGGDLTQEQIARVHFCASAWILNGFTHTWFFSVDKIWKLRNACLLSNRLSTQAWQANGETAAATKRILKLRYWLSANHTVFMQHTTLLIHESWILKRDIYITLNICWPQHACEKSNHSSLINLKGYSCTQQSISGGITAQRMDNYTVHRNFSHRASWKSCILSSPDFFLAI